MDVHFKDDIACKPWSLETRALVLCGCIRIDLYNGVEESLCGLVDMLESEGGRGGQAFSLSPLFSFFSVTAVCSRSVSHPHTTQQ